MPGDGDSVYIPSGVNVLLDVSTANLGLVIMDGNLEWDDSLGAAANISFDANYILVRSLADRALRMLAGPDHQ